MMRIAVLILVIMLAYAGIYSLMSIFVPKLVMESIFSAITDKPLSSIQDAGYLKALSGRQMHAGMYTLTTVIAGFFVLFAGFQKAQKWGWWGFLVVGGIAWLWGLIYSIVIGDNLSIIFMLIGTVLLLVGLFLPYKSFFGKKA